jgi:hypothetical protein
VQVVDFTHPVAVGEGAVGGSGHGPATIARVPG